MFASVCGVVFVKGMSLLTNVMRPPPSPLLRSSLSVVYPGNFGVFWFGLSLVSWIAAMWMLCL